MSSQHPRVSVALATYNGARFLAGQLKSLTEQAEPPLELVVADDGSSDGTLEIVEQFSGSAPFPVRIFRNAERLGYRQNFMRAAELCSGDLISFCDQDDVWAKDKVSLSAAPFRDPDVLLVYHNARLIDSNGKPGGYVLPQNENSATLTLEDIEPWRIIPGFSQTIRRSLLRYTTLHQESRDMFDLDERMPHDQWFLFLASALGSIRYVGRSLAEYRQHDSNTSGWLPAKPLAFALHNIAYASYYVRSTHNSLEGRIVLLEKLKEMVPSAEHARIDAVIGHYQHVTQFVRRRLDLYKAKSARVRARLLWSMIRDRTYSSEKVRFGRGSLLLDTVIGVPVGHNLR